MFIIILSVNNVIYKDCKFIKIIFSDQKLVLDFRSKCKYLDYSSIFRLYRLFKWDNITLINILLFIMSSLMYFYNFFIL